MADDTLTYRPAADVAGDVATLTEWCRANGQSINSVLNSFMPAISYAVTHMCIVDEATGQLYVRADFGALFLRPPHYRSDYQSEGLSVQGKH